MGTGAERSGGAASHQPGTTRTVPGPAPFTEQEEVKVGCSVRNRGMQLSGGGFLVGPALARVPSLLLSPHPSSTPLSAPKFSLPGPPLWLQCGTGRVPFGSAWQKSRHELRFLLHGERSSGGWQRRGGGPTEPTGTQSTALCSWILARASLAAGRKVGGKLAPWPDCPLYLHPVSQQVTWPQPTTREAGGSLGRHVNSGSVTTRRWRLVDVVTWHLCHSRRRFLRECLWLQPW